MNAPTADETSRSHEAVDRLKQPAFELVALAASAGGLNALSQVLSGLPAGFPAATVVVQHLDPNHRSLMVDIFSRRTSLPVQQVQQGDRLCPGVIYIAPPNYHTLVNSDGTFDLSQSERVRFVRPSADRLFESVAANYGKRAIAVVLTGTGKDGSTGIQAIKQQGGLVIAQDQATAQFFSMPEAAIRTGMVDFVLPLAEISTKLIALVETNP